jgi:hypothetical protein
MRIREYTDADFTALKKLHNGSGFDYVLPPMESFYSKRVVDNDRLGMAVLQRLSSEVYLICDPDWRTPAWRLEAIRQLHSVCTTDALLAGAQEAHVFLPPDMRNFGKRLVRFGWSMNRPEWPSYSKELT